MIFNNRSAFYVLCRSSLTCTLQLNDMDSQLHVLLSKSNLEGISARLSLWP